MWPNDQIPFVVINLSAENICLEEGHICGFLEEMNIMMEKITKSV